jgi:hypothetical protein
MQEVIKILLLSTEDDNVKNRANIFKLAQTVKAIDETRSGRAILTAHHSRR